MVYDDEHLFASSAVFTDARPARKQPMEQSTMNRVLMIRCAELFDTLVRAWLRGSYLLRRIGSTLKSALPNPHLPGFFLICSDRLREQLTITKRRYER